MDFPSHLLENFEHFLKKKFQKTIYSPTFQESIQYSILSGGKRLRPLFYISLWEAMEKDLPLIFPFAAATECIHSYALVHDDLPCMDNDDYRRGKASNHKKFGEATALLAGDALLTESFALLFEENVPKSFSPPVFFKALKSLSHQAKMMIHGQSLDIQTPKQFANKKQAYLYLQEMQAGKTAALFQSCFEIPAILAEVNFSLKKTLKEIAFNIGVCYQIQDDILDAEKEEKNITYSSLFGKKKQKKFWKKKKKLCFNR